MGKLSRALEKALSDETVVTPAEKMEVRKTDITGMNGAGPGEEKNVTGPRGERLPDILTGDTGRWDERIRISTDSSSPLAESFRRLRSKIVHPEGDAPLRTILVTSVGPEEGKGFVCANLGVALAQGLEHHALIVDCDLRRPSMAENFGLPNEVGLVDYLRDKVSITHLIRKTGLAKLSVIPSGRPPQNPAELLDSKAMTQLIDEVKTRYDDRFIIFDSPPNIVASETMILAQKVDGVVLVVRWGRAGRQQVKDLVEMIGKEKIVGIVFNAYEENLIEKYFKKQGYRYDSYYTYSKYTKPKS